MKRTTVTPEYIELLEAAKSLVRHLSNMENGKWLANKPGQDLIAVIGRAEERHDVCSKG